MTTVDGVIEEIRRVYKEIPRERVFFSLKQIGFKPIKIETVDTVMWCIAISKLGFRITPRLLVAVTGKWGANVRHYLHNLGDKQVLTLIRAKGVRHTGKKGMFLQYIMNPIFMRYFERESVKQ